MNRFLVKCFFLLSSYVAYSQGITSPDGLLRMEFILDNGTPFYCLNYKGKSVINKSRLGIETEEISLKDDFEIVSTDTVSFDEIWNPVWGEYSSIRNNYKELSVTLRKKQMLDESIVLRFRLFNDGLGFRYEFPEENAVHYMTVSDEMTEFNLTGNHKTFCIPGDYDTNEFAYTTAPLSDIKEGMEKNLNKKGYETQATSFSVQTPLMMKSKDGLYINIHEAALVDYSSMMLNVDDKNFRLSAHLVPDKLGKKGYLQVPCKSPWRTVIVSDDARDILASQLIYNLNEPCKFDDTSWIKPLKFIGVWWEMFTGDGKTWAYSDYVKAKPGVTDYSKLKSNGRHPANTENVKYYIDFASENGIDAVLVEGWNEGWEDWGSYRKERHFLFDKAYPDFDVKELKEYAESKGVKIIMHHETASNAADYERQLDRAFEFMVQNGYNSVKTGYVGYVIPRSEYHYSQWMNNHYIHVVKRAADYKIMVDSHEAVRPTGLCRTYPNWLAQESARGGEFESMGGNEPDHTTILPFTRLKGGPMDYTPGLFETKLSYYGDGKKNEQAGTTLAKQLALYVTMPSPIQMASDLPSNYRRFMDAFQFIKDVAVDWDDSRYLEAEPGDYITVARKAKGTEDWYVGAITDENARTVNIDLSFLPKGMKFEATIYSDTKKTNWKYNPQEYEISKMNVNNETKIKKYLAPGGGMAISIKLIK